MSDADGWQRVGRSARDAVDLTGEAADELESDVPPALREGGDLAPAPMGASVSRLLETPWRGLARPDGPPARKRQRVVVLCGVIGSGKTTLSTQWCALRPDEWSRVCQDELRDRQACEKRLEAHLAAGRSGIVDRQNFDKAQRAYWLDIARRFDAECCALVLTTPPDECERRLRLRTGHRTLPNPQKALKALPAMLRQYRPPTDAEGFDRIVRLMPLPRVLEPERLDALLAALDRAPVQSRLSLPPPRPAIPPPPANAWGRAPAQTLPSASVV